LEIIIKDKRLSKCINVERKLIKEYGQIMAKKIQIRLNGLKNSETLEDTKFLPGNFHELTGNRKGQWACDLDQPKRLVFEPVGDSIPTDEDGKYIWKEIKSVRILEILDYH
jgi:proteic killer suppression protein